MCRFVKIDWDSDGVELPMVLKIPNDVEDDEVCDWLCEEYGFCVNSWSECEVETREEVLDGAVCNQTLWGLLYSEAKKMADKFVKKEYSDDEFYELARTCLDYATYMVERKYPVLQNEEWDEDWDGELWYDSFSDELLEAIQDYFLEIGLTKEDCETA